MTARRVNRRRGRGGWIVQMALDVAAALIGFVYLVALIAVVAMIGDGMCAL